MSGMYGGLVLAVFLLFGFAYIIWVMASKEAGAVKLTGQIIAVVIAVITLLILIYGGVYGGRMRGMMGRGGMSGGQCGMCGQCMMMDSGKMMKSPEKHGMMQNKMMEHMKK